MPVDKQGYKKKYLLRVIEDKEIDDDIKHTLQSSTGGWDQPVQVPEVQQLDQKNVF